MSEWFIVELVGGVKKWLMIKGTKINWKKFTGEKNGFYFTYISKIQ